MKTKRSKNTRTKALINDKMRDADSGGREVYNNVSRSPLDWK